MSYPAFTNSWNIIGQIVDEFYVLAVWILKEESGSPTGSSTAWHILIMPCELYGVLCSQLCSPCVKWRGEGQHLGRADTAGKDFTITPDVEGKTTLEEGQRTQGVE